MDADREFREKSLAVLAALFERDPENEELAMRLLDELLARQDGSEAARVLYERLLQVSGMRRIHRRRRHPRGARKRAIERPFDGSSAGISSWLMWRGYARRARKVSLSRSESP